MSTQSKVLRAVEDLNARLKTEEKALEQADLNKKRVLDEKEALAARLAVADKKQRVDIQKRLTALDKRFRFQCELEERHRLQIDDIKIKQKKLSEDLPSLLKTGQYDILANAKFSITRTADERKTVHTASPAAFSVHRLANLAAKLTPRGKERFFRHVRLNGIAQADTRMTAPASGLNTVCYETNVYLILENKTETLVWHDEYFDTLCISDKHANDKLYVDADGYGARLSMDTLMDNVMRADELPASIKDNMHLPSQILNYHVVEKAILPGCPLHIEGKAYIYNQSLHMRRVFDRTHTPLVTSKRISATSRRRILCTAVYGLILIFAAIILLSDLL